jgi:hypothetical protein
MLAHDLAGEPSILRLAWSVGRCERENETGEENESDWMWATIHGHS